MYGQKSISRYEMGGSSSQRQSSLDMYARYYTVYGRIRERYGLRRRSRCGLWISLIFGVYLGVRCEDRGEKVVRK